MQTLETGSALPVTRNIEAYTANTEKEKQEFRDSHRYLQMKADAKEAAEAEIDWVSIHTIDTNTSEEEEASESKKPTLGEKKESGTPKKECKKARRKER